MMQNQPSPTSPIFYGTVTAKTMSCCGNNIELATILGTSITGAQGPIGPAGPTGATGPAGPAGPQGSPGPGTIIVRATIDTAPSASQYLTGQIMYVEDIDAFYQVTNGQWVLVGSKDLQEATILPNTLLFFTAAGGPIFGTFSGSNIDFKFKFVNGAVLVNFNISWTELSASNMRYFWVAIDTLPEIAAYLSNGATLDTSIESTQVIYSRVNGVLTNLLVASIGYRPISPVGYYLKVENPTSDWGQSQGETVSVSFDFTLYIKPKVTL